MDSTEYFVEYTFDSIKWTRFITAHQSFRKAHDHIQWMMDMPLEGMPRHYRVRHVVHRDFILWSTEDNELSQSE